MSSTRYHWLTRPVTDSEILSQTLTSQGIANIISPVMEISLLPAPLPTITADAVILTSRHAAQALNTLFPQSIPVFCVGTATAEAVRQMGFANTIMGDGDVLSLIPQLLQTMPEQSKMVYFSGDDIRIDLTTLLKTKQRHVERIVTYKAESANSLSPELITALKQEQITSISLFSPKSASVAMELLKQHELEQHASSIQACCLSLAVAEAAALLPWQSIDVCNSPTAMSMQDLIVSKHITRV